MITIKCRKPLLELCGDVSRISIDLGSCPSCPPEVISLRLREAGCDEYKEVEVVECCEKRVLCCGGVSEVTLNPTTRIERVLIQKRSVTYPLHEMDTKGNAVFVLDNKFKELGYGRYEGVVDLGDCGRYEFDLDYTCGKFEPVGINADNMRGC